MTTENLQAINRIAFIFLFLISFGGGGGAGIMTCCIVWNVVETLKLWYSREERWIETGSDVST